MLDGCDLNGSKIAKDVLLLPVDRLLSVRVQQTQQLDLRIESDQIARCRRVIRDGARVRRVG